MIKDSQGSTDPLRKSVKADIHDGLWVTMTIGEVPLLKVNILI